MTAITSDITAGEASFLLGWALYSMLDTAYPGRVRLPHDDAEWLTAPGHTMFVPVDVGASVAELAGAIRPTIQHEIERQRESSGPSDAWFVELDYWAHALSGDSERIEEGLRFDVVVTVRG